MHLLPLSGRTEAALGELAGRYAVWLEKHTDVPLADACFTAGVGRNHLEHRAAILATSHTQATEALLALQRGQEHPDLLRGSTARPRLALLFSGQAAHYHDMALGLYRNQPVFRDVIDRCASALGDELGRPLQEVLFGPQAATLLEHTCFAQPALFAVAIALFELYRAWGFCPDAVLGHSLGEYAAAYAAGMLTLDEGARLVARRGRLMEQLPAGRMMAVFASPHQIEEAVAADASLAVAAYNGPHTVVSGPVPAVEQLAGRFEAAGIRCVRLQTSHAFHSAMLEPMLEALQREAEAVAWRAPEVTGQVAAGGRPVEASYWRRQAREPVQFARSVQVVAELGCTVLLELGPQPTLGATALACWPRGNAAPVVVAALRRGTDDGRQSCRAVAELYAAGLTPDFTGWDRPWPRRKVALPTYPFQRQRFWVDPPTRRTLPGQHVHPLLGVRYRLADSAERRYEQLLSEDRPSWVADHRVFDQVVFPAAAYVELMLAAAGEGLALEHLAVEAPLSLLEERVIQTVVRSRDTIEIFAQVGDTGWQRHAHARVVPRKAPAGEPIDLSALRSRCRTEVDVEKLYGHLAAAGLAYGPAFQTLHRLHTGDGEVLAELRLRQDLANHRTYCLPPMLLDGALQASAGLDANGEGGIYLPIGIERVRLYGPIGSSVLAHGRLRDTGGDRYLDLVLLDENGGVLTEVDSVRLRPASSQVLRQLLGDPANDLVYRVRWEQTQSPPPSEHETGVWLVVGDSLRREALRDALATERQSVQLGDHTDAPALLDQVLGRGGHNGTARGLTGVVWLVPRSDVVGDLLSVARGMVEPLLRMVQRLLDHNISLASGLNIVTSRAVASEPGEEVDPLQASLWGLGRSLQAEQPQLNARLMDAEATAATLTRVILGKTEPQLVQRAEQTFVPRLTPQARDRSLNPPAVGDYRLGISQRGSLDRLQFEPVEIPPPAVGEVQVEVHAAGLNFRDVLNALGAYPGDPGLLGGEVAGVVTAVGEGVGHLSPGNRVFGFAAGGLGTRCTTAAELLCRIPEGVDFADAATVPTTFCTAQAAFELASLLPGERVLIHAAAGGVGLAAVALAQARGAMVYATSSTAKRDYLHGRGVRHVYDSRSTAFAERILADTGGAGVHVVLNSLTSEGFIAASLRALARGGRFVEIGKRDIWSAGQMRQARPDVEYHVLALDEWIEGQPTRVRGLLEGITARLGGELQPLRRLVYPLAEGVSAFRTMQQARHIGKVVLTVNRPAIRQGAGYLITGGLGVLGLETAAWLAEQGAECLVLVGRRSPGDDVRWRLGQLQERHGCTIHVESADVSIAAEVEALVKRFDHEWPPLRGIIHAAGVLDDGVLSELNWERFERVFRPKALGAWHLYQTTRRLPLDFYVLYSSMASVLGSAGQGNYALANAFLDGLAEHRKAQGLVATSAQWGPWLGAGMAADTVVQGRLEQQGLVFLKADRALGSLAQLLATGISGAVLDADWQQMSRHLGNIRPPMLGLLLTPAPSGGDDRLAQRLRTASGTARAALLSEHLQDELCHILRMADRPPVNVGFFDLGMDSLMAVELRNRLQTQLGDVCRLSNTLAFDYPTIQRLADQIASQFAAPNGSDHRNGAAKVPAPSSEPRPDIQQLERATPSQVIDEIERLLQTEEFNVVK
jgi:candicidin polyketide synthase FscE